MEVGRRSSGTATVAASPAAGSRRTARPLTPLHPGDRQTTEQRRGHVVGMAFDPGGQGQHVRLSSRAPSPRGRPVRSRWPRTNCPGRDRAECCSHSARRYRVPVGRTSWKALRTVARIRWSGPRFTSPAPSPFTVTDVRSAISKVTRSRNSSASPRQSKPGPRVREVGRRLHHHRHQMRPSSAAAAGASTAMRTGCGAPEIAHCGSFQAVAGDRAHDRLPESSSPSAWRANSPATPAAEAGSTNTLRRPQATCTH